ncbi:hypothetical protein ACJ73_10188 [Blastomyces percursus]|uniref:Uncharacterized protein n=1 Tax=Blastomyces percursus TaxID=1658174 RepID=A0A1J9NZR5_9EURO|nr:hypothetical protein ACJ73_10188 [Blastomyces percursus]
MADNSSPDYEALYRKAEAERRQVEEREAEEKVGTPSRSTKGSIPPSTGKYCPTSLRFWSSCPVQLQEIYDSVSPYLQPAGKDAPRPVSSLLVLEDLGRRYSSRKLQSERDLEHYERTAVEDYVRDIIDKLCEIPDARKRFRLGDGIMFENHENVLQTEESDVQLFDESSTKHPKPDSFCIHRINDSTNTLVTTVEYKPPPKLSVENLRAGLRPMKLWEEIVQSDTIPKSDEQRKDEKLKYNAEQLTCSVLVQEYHVMIQAGLEYSYITNGFAIVLLRVPYSEPSTLYCYLCEPNMDVISE